MKLSNLILMVAIALGVVFLAGLGTWQMKRLAWKEGLIERVQKNLTEPPLPLSQIETMLTKNEDIEYRPVWVTGRVNHGLERHYFATFKGQPGYFVYTPLTRPSGQVIFVNRGFVPLTKKATTDRVAGQVAGEIRISGLARSAPLQKPNRFVPDNDFEKNVYHWKSLSQMTERAYGKDSPSIAQLFVDADSTPNPGKLPRGGVTRITFPNSHLQYALTWFGLAGALLIVGGYFLSGRLKSQ